MNQQRISMPLSLVSDLVLDEKWNKHVSTHLGMVVNGFPNMYMICGPQAPTSLTSGPPFLEMQCKSALNQQRDEELVAVEANQEEEDKWPKQVLDLANMTLAIHTNS
jgi:hypothetical protein